MTDRNAWIYKLSYGKLKQLLKSVDGQIGRGRSNLEKLYERKEIIISQIKMYSNFYSNKKRLIKNPKTHKF